MILFKKLMHRIFVHVAFSVKNLEKCNTPVFKSVVLIKLAHTRKVKEENVCSQARKDAAVCRKFSKLTRLWSEEVRHIHMSHTFCTGKII